MLGCMSSPVNGIPLSISIPHGGQRSSRHRASSSVQWPSSRTATSGGMRTLLQYSTQPFPAILIPSHSHSHSNSNFNSHFHSQKKKKDLHLGGLVGFRRRRTQQTVEASPSEEADTQQHQFKSSFDEYLKAMESVNNTRRLQTPPLSVPPASNNKDKRRRKPPTQTPQLTPTRTPPIKRDSSAPPKPYSFNKSEEGGGLVPTQKQVWSRTRIQVDNKKTPPVPVPDRFQPTEDDIGIVGRRITRMEMEERIQKLAKGLNGADIDMPEWMFSKMMRSAQIKFCDHSILRVIQILGKLGNWRRVLQVLEWLQMRERYVSYKLRHVYTAALDALGKAKRPVEALNLFRAMQQQKSTYPDVIAYHCIAVTLGQAGHMNELFDVMDSMRSVPKNFKVSEALPKMDPRLEPDIVVYNAVLNACIRQKQWEGAFWVLQQLKQACLKPTSTTFGLVMEVMLACGKYNLVHDFFKKVQKSSIPNTLTYRVVVNTLWREGRTDEAIEAVQDMERRGIIGSASLYYDLARCLCSAGRCEEALVQVNKICKVASRPLVVTYTGLIQSCLDAGRIQDGTFIFNHMHEYCSPNLVTCNIMLKAFVEHGMLNEATELFQKMLQNGRIRGSFNEKGSGVTPDIYTFNTMLEALVTHEKWDDFENAYEQMLNHGHHFNTKRHLWMVMKASSAGKVGSVETTWNHLMQEDRVPPPALVKERFQLKLKTSDLMAALSTVTSHPSTHQQSFSKEAWLDLLQRGVPHTGTRPIQHLICDLQSYISSGESPNLILSNLLDSCKEVVRNDDNVARLNRIEQPWGVHSLTP